MSPPLLRVSGCMDASLICGRLRDSWGDQMYIPNPLTHPLHQLMMTLISANSKSSGAVTSAHSPPAGSWLGLVYTTQD